MSPLSMQNGDLNWICKGRILAFAGPSYKTTISPEGYCTLSPADYIPYFQSRNVGLVVRLNKKNYNEQDFLSAGIGHLDQFYLDGSCPPMEILQRVLQAFEDVPQNKAFAVHCKAGLGRTGTCIGAYLMKHFRMTATEVISWMRICRPGSVIGPQQQFLTDLQPIMWQEGEMLSIPASIIRNSKRDGHETPKRKPKLLSLDEFRSPEPTVDAISGRPGQADGLLSRKSPRNTKPMVVTPEKKESHDWGGISWLLAMGRDYACGTSWYAAT